MKTFVIQTDSRLVITQNKDVAIISSHFMKTTEKVVTVQISEPINLFDVTACSLVNPAGKVMIVDAVVSIGHEMNIEFSGSVSMNQGNILLNNFICVFGTTKCDDAESNFIIAEIVRKHLIKNQYSIIKQFYNE